MLAGVASRHTGRDLDNVDRSIRYPLQRDARTTTTQEVGGRVGVSASTVRNRIARLESDGNIRGSHPDIDYQAANLPAQVTFILSVPPKRLQVISETLRMIRGVVDVRELPTGRRDIHMDVAATVRRRSSGSPTPSTTPTPTSRVRR